MPAAVEGHCDPRFEPLRDAFQANFAERGELGAAVCVMVDGRVVADLYGGWADQEHGRRWQPDTLVNVFSVGKGLVAACTARLTGQGKLDLDTTVTAYWPEFAAANKDAITVRQLLSHQAGLPAVRRRLPPGAMLDWPAMTTALAEQDPWWQPGTAHGYHVNTFGFLAGEVDPPHHRHHGRKAAPRRDRRPARRRRAHRPARLRAQTRRHVHLARPAARRGTNRPASNPPS